MSDTVIQPTDLPAGIVETTACSNEAANEDAETTESLFRTDLSLGDAIMNIESELILASYQRHQSTRKVARELQISQSRASRLIRKYLASADNPS
ncbi:hypothetical protein [Alicyclobacillus dauci]|uniref:hypothetical protein n=1 Tax=Alicyclobacillus dauci TaxID=1475485 RepID=UPI0038994A69